MMMKKLLVLLMVMSLASVANAGLVVNYAAPALNVQTDPLDSIVPQQAVFLVTTGTLQLDAGQMLYTGTKAAITNMTGDPDLAALANGVLGATGPMNRIDFVELLDATVTPPPVTGKVATYSALSGQGWVFILDADITRTISSAEIPEPVTITLLGLGGLMLRRRR